MSKYIVVYRGYPVLLAEVNEDKVLVSDYIPAPIVNLADKKIGEPIEKTADGRNKLPSFLYRYAHKAEPCKVRFIRDTPYGQSGDVATAYFLTEESSVNCYFTDNHLPFDGRLQMSVVETIFD